MTHQRERTHRASYAAMNSHLKYRRKAGHIIFTKRANVKDDSTPRTSLYLQLFFLSTHPSSTPLISSCCRTLLLGPYVSRLEGDSRRRCVYASSRRAMSSGIGSSDVDPQKRIDWPFVGTSRAPLIYTCGSL